MYYVHVLGTCVSGVGIYSTAVDETSCFDERTVISPGTGLGFLVVGTILPSLSMPFVAEHGSDLFRCTQPKSLYVSTYVDQPTYCSLAIHPCCPQRCVDHNPFACCPVFLLGRVPGARTHRLLVNAARSEPAMVDRRQKKHGESAKVA